MVWLKGIAFVTLMYPLNMIGVKKSSISLYRDGVSMERWKKFANRKRDEMDIRQKLHEHELPSVRLEGLAFIILMYPLSMIGIK
jgi:hypothetical protein